MTDLILNVLERFMSAVAQPEGAFWEGLCSGEVRVQCCRSCGGFQHPAERLCGDCGSLALESVPVSGRGVVYTFTVVHRAAVAPFDALIPYVAAVVELDEGPRLMALIREPADSVFIGLRVEPVFLSAGSQTLLVYQRAVGHSGDASHGS